MNVEKKLIQSSWASNGLAAKQVASDLNNSKRKQTLWTRLYKTSFKSLKRIKTKLKRD